MDNPEEIAEAVTEDKSVQTDATTSPRTSSHVTTLRKKLASLRSQRRRLRRKIGDMKGLVDELRSRSLASTELQKLLNDNFFGLPLQIMQNMARNAAIAKESRRYTDEMKQFAITLYFYSPKAYKFVRNHIPLPHKSLISRWLSTVNGDPGILEGVFEYLKENVKEKPHLRNVGLIFDGMAIRKQQVYDSSRGKMVGFVDLGGIQTAESEELASEALVFQIVSFTQQFKVPVAYFFTDKKISGELQAQVVTSIVEKLHGIGVTVRSVTADGTAANLCTFETLGCDFGKDMKNYFEHPTTREDICVFLDPAHMLKLARNALADVGTFKSPDGEVSWQYIIRLNKTKCNSHLQTN